MRYGKDAMIVWHVSINDTKQIRRHGHGKARINFCYVGRETLQLLSLHKTAKMHG